MIILFSLAWMKINCFVCHYFFLDDIFISSIAWCVCVVLYHLQLISRRVCYDCWCFFLTCSSELDFCIERCITNLADFLILQQHRQTLSITITITSTSTMNSVPHPASVVIVTQRDNAIPNMVSLCTGCTGVSCGII